MVPRCVVAFLAIVWRSRALALNLDFTSRQAPASNATAGNIFFDVGQNYESEWQNFAKLIKKPAGISVYGDIYSGALNPDSQTLLSTYAQSNTYEQSPALIDS